MVSEVISLSPMLSSSRTIFDPSSSTPPPPTRPLRTQTPRGLGRLSGLPPFGRKRIPDFDGQFADVFELGHAETAAGAGWRAEPDAGRDHRLFRIERNAVLVAGDMRAAERHVGDLAGQLLRP